MKISMADLAALYPSIGATIAQDMRKGLNFAHEKGADLATAKFTINTAFDEVGVFIRTSVTTHDASRDMTAEDMRDTAAQACRTAAVTYEPRSDGAKALLRMAEQLDALPLARQA